MSDHDPLAELADAPGSLRDLADWFDDRASYGSVVVPRGHPPRAPWPDSEASAHLNRWADEIERLRAVKAVEMWKFLLGVTLGMLAAFLWGWLSAGGQL